MTAWLLPLLLVLLFTRLLAFFLSFLFFVVNSLVLDAAAQRARGRVRRDLRRGTGSSGARSSKGPRRVMPARLVALAHAATPPSYEGSYEVSYEVLLRQRSTTPIRPSDEGSYAASYEARGPRASSRLPAAVNR